MDSNFELTMEKYSIAGYDRRDPNSKFSAYEVIACDEQCRNDQTRSNIITEKYNNMGYAITKCIFVESRIAVLDLNKLFDSAK